MAARLSKVFRNAVNCKSVALDNTSNEPWGRGGVQSWTERRCEMDFTLRG